ncbi:hypothetical protein EON66_02060 [archaeon]|nr:MAG: hypothetical protein EON66_02060 [archaeon]
MRGVLPPVVGALLLLVSWWAASVHPATAAIASFYDATACPADHASMRLLASVAFSTCCQRVLAP